MNLLTEAGINRVFVRSTLTPGTIVVTATRSGLASANAAVTSKAVPVVDGLVHWILYRRDPTDQFYIGDPSEDDEAAFEERMRTFRPFKRASAVLAAATGYEVSTVKRAYERERRRLLGRGAEPRYPD